VNTVKSLYTQHKKRTSCFFLLAVGCPFSFESKVKKILNYGFHNSKFKKTANDSLAVVRMDEFPWPFLFVLVDISVVL